MERNVKLAVNYSCYVIVGEHGTSCLGFDNALDQAERIAVELVGRGALPESYIGRELDALKMQRGSIEAYDGLMNLRDLLRRTCETEGDQAVADLTPQLIGLEGHRVEVSEGGETWRFIVGKSTGWLPCHLELKRIDSTGGDPALREYDLLIDLGRVR